MSLTSALDISRSSLKTTSDLIQLASRNIANANNSNATRKIGTLVTAQDGSPQLGTVTRSVAGALRDGVVTASSDAARLEVVRVALNSLDLTRGGSDGLPSPASRVGDFVAALQLYSANPAELWLANNVINSANDLTTTIRNWAVNTADVRAAADADIRTSVSQLNSLLGRFGELNAAIVNGSEANADVTDAMDARDSLAVEISQIVGVSAVSRPGNGMALYADSGLVLFDVKPRDVAVATQSLTDGAAGPPVLIDGVRATGAGAVMPIVTGRLAGLVEVRDHISLQIAAQLDELASGLIRSFAEADQSNAHALPDAAGLFRRMDTTTVPAAGIWVPGTARVLEVNGNADPARGGVALRLRDGGISDPLNPVFSYNPSSAAGFSERVEQLLRSLDQVQAFDPAGSVGASATIADFSAASAGWLQGRRQTNDRDANYANALMQRAHDALVKQSGISIDDEMAQLLEFERTYQASAKLISAVDVMFGALMQAIR